MRSLALLLILLNLAFFYWHTAHREPALPVEHSSQAAGPPGVAHLVLLSEREDPRDAERSAAAAPSLHCETVGPLADRTMAEVLREHLEAQGVLASLRSASREVVSSYWVFLPPRSNREAARELAARLTDEGLQDLYVINEGQYVNGLSLGLFSEHERARRRVAEVESLGHTAQIEARFRTQTVFWLDLVVPVDRVADLDLPGDLGRVPRGCPDAAVTVP